MCMITCQVGSTESKCWELEGGIIYNGTVQLGKEISAWPYKICCLVYCQRMGCKMWSLSKDLDSKNDFGANDLCCVFCGEYALNCIVCVCVCVLGVGKDARSDSLISYIPLVNKAGSGEVLQAI